MLKQNNVIRILMKMLKEKKNVIERLMICLKEKNVQPAPEGLGVVLDHPRFIPAYSREILHTFRSESPNK